MTVPAPDQLPAMPANGPDCAWLAELNTEAANKVVAAKISRRAIATGAAVWTALLPRRFPPTAARYACRCSIPLPPSGIATELAVRICTIDGYPHKPFPSDAAGYVGAGG